MPNGLARLLVFEVVAREEVRQVAARDFCCIALRARHVWREQVLIPTLHGNTADKSRACAPSVGEIGGSRFFVLHCHGLSIRIVEEPDPSDSSKPVKGSFSL